MENEPTKKRKLHVVIIDSGLNYSCQNVIHSVTIKEENGQIITVEGCQDENGHGTAVYELIEGATKDLEIEYSMIKVLNEDFTCSCDVLIYALNYIYENLTCDIVHISAGLTISSDLILIENAVNQLHKKGCIIVSAFDNEGAISYPAAFSYVIGVDVTNECTKKDQYCYVEGSVVNIRVANIVHRAHWKDNKKVFLRGNSFGATLVTAKILHLMNECEDYDFNQILHQLEQDAWKVYKKKEYGLRFDTKQIAKSIKKAAIFPFNKEMHALAANEQELAFEVVGYYDIKFSKSVGKRISDVYPHIKNDRVVDSYTNIPWDDFDTLILGHCDELNDLYKTDLCAELLSLCIEKGKKVYSFSNVSNKVPEFEKITNTIAFPFIHLNDIPQNQFNKLYRCGKPVLAVLGTSSKQGKFTLQLQLRRRFQQDFKVGQLSTEPNGYLFGMDEVYPMGYDSTVYIKGIDNVTVINNQMHQIEMTDPDIILVGGQSGVIPYSYGNLRYVTDYNFDLLLGALPDAAILCVNANDNKEYIKKSISFIESIGHCKVIAIVVFPQELKVDALGMRVTKQDMDSERIQKVQEELKETFQRNAYILGECIQEELYQEIISYFTR